MKFDYVQLTNYFDIVSPGIKPFKGNKKYIATGSMETGEIVGFDQVSYESRPSRANMETVEDDILFAKMKDTEKVFIITRKETENIYSTGFSILRVRDRTQFEPKFVYYWLRSDAFKRVKNRDSTGATQKALNEGRLAKFRIPKPPLETQKKLVVIFEKVDKLIELRLDADKLTDEFLKSVFYEIFGDPVKNTKKWPLKNLKEFGKIKTGNTPPRKELNYYGDFIDWIKSDNLNTPFTYLTQSEEKLSQDGAKVGRIAPKRSVLVTCIAGSLSAIGNAGIAQKDVAFNQQINAIIPNTEVNELFLYYLLVNSKTYIQSFSTHSMKGMISKGVFEKISLIYPASKLQFKFGEISQNIEMMKDKQNESKKQIDYLFKALIQNTFRGDSLC